jgi:hypothetical protein
MEATSFSVTFLTTNGTPPSFKTEAVRQVKNYDRLALMCTVVLFGVWADVRPIHALGMGAQRWQSEHKRRVCKATDVVVRVYEDYFALWV